MQSPGLDHRDGGENRPPVYFGEWLKDRRKALDLTQAELAQRAGCSLPGLRKIEAGERRPSKQLAELLARSLEIPYENQATFVRVARGELNVERLPALGPVQSSGHRTEPGGQPLRINLPVQPNRLVGREAELVSLGRLLADPHCRLLTITGMGGMGKTRLAIEAAAAAHHRFPDGVHFVGLAALTSPAFIVSAITDALGLDLAGQKDPRTALLNALRTKNLLLVLDNAEHLLGEVGLFTEMLQRAPLLKLLVTSRERLNFHGEWVFEIQGLPVPWNDEVEQVERYSSIELFIQRARQAQSNFDPGPAEQPWIMQICQIVEGMPLGIELAAAWVSVLTCQEIYQEIDANLDFLASNIRDIPERHRSLRATFDHSWKRLSPQEQTVLGKLSVFQGGFARQAAERVAGASLPILSSLMGKSLIYHQSDTHFDMHQLIRQFAAGKLEQDLDVHAQTLEQHRQYFVDLLSHLHPEMRGPKMQASLETIQDDLDNVREAWQRTVSERKFIGLRPAEKCLYDFFELRDRTAEGYSIISLTVEGFRSELVKHPDDLELQTLLGLLLIDQSFFGSSYLKRSEVIGIAREGYAFLRNGNDQPAFGFAALWMASINSQLGDIGSAERYLAESLEIFKRCSDERGVAAALWSQARFALTARQFEEGARAAAQAEMIYERHNDHEGLHRTFTIQGELAYHAGQFDQAKEILDKALALSRTNGSLSQTGYTLSVLSQLAQHQDHLQEARSLIEESLAYLPKQDLLINHPLFFRRYGCVLTALGDFQDARQWLCKSLQLLISLEIVTPAMDVLLDYARLLARQADHQQALAIVSYIIGEPRTRPLTKHYAELLHKELLPGLTPEQIEAASEYAQTRGFDSVVSEILG